MSASVISANTDGCDPASDFLTISSSTFVSSVAALRTRSRTSPSELQVREINRSLQRQQRDLAFQQQTEFELNQLRHSLHRHQTFPSRTFGAICAPGQIRC